MDCTFLPLALVIAGSTPPVMDEPLSADAWWQLHDKLQKKAQMQGWKRMEQKPLRVVLGVSYEELGEEQQKDFVKLAVLPYDATAPIGMLCHLWDKPVSIVLADKLPKHYL